MKVHALILAGGEGSRLGFVRKATLRIGNRRLIDSVAERLPNVDSVLVATGPGPAVPLGVGTGLSDGVDTHGGPMSGLKAALRHLGDDGAEGVILTVAVDTPFLPEDYGARLLDAISAGANAACAAWGGRIYPTNAAWRLCALPPVDDLPHSPKALLEMLGGGIVDWSGSAAQNPFANLNSLADLVSLSRRAMGATG